MKSLAILSQLIAVGFIANEDEYENIISIINDEHNYNCLIYRIQENDKIINKLFVVDKSTLFYSKILEYENKEIDLNIKSHVMNYEMGLYPTQVSTMETIFCRKCSYWNMVNLFYFK
jgi:hypothetical protein